MKFETDVIHELINTTENNNQKYNVMLNYLKAKNEFNQKLSELKNETHPSIYARDLSDIVLYQKLMELQEQINRMKDQLMK